MFETILPFLFALGFVLVVWWIFLAVRLFGMLRTYHPVTYAELGSPDFFNNNTSKTSCLLLSFLIRGKYKELNDPAVESLCRFMHRFIGVYLILLLTLSVCVVEVIRQRRPHF
jgi:hypothetical protein